MRTPGIKNRVQRILAYASLGGLVVIPVAGCGGGGPEAVGPCVSVLIDTSLTTEDDALKQGYLEDANVVLTSVAGERGVVLIGEIGNNATGARAVLGRIDFTAPAGLNDLDRRAWRAAQTLGAQELARTIITQPGAVSGTASFAAVRSAAEALRREPACTTRRLVVLSDGYATKPFNVAGLDLATPDKVDAAVGRLRSGGMIANLEGIVVYLPGLGNARPGRRQNPDIDDLWNASVADGRGRTVPGVGARLTRFP